MKLKIYILGVLKKFGSLHGYKIQKILSSQFGPLTNLKLPNIYYHLQKMEDDGYLNVKLEREGKRPEKFIYSITEKGEEQFITLVEKALRTVYEPDPDINSVLYFLDLLNHTKIIATLKEQEEYLTKKIKAYQKQRSELYTVAKDEDKSIFKFLFEHQLIHLRAELKWLKKVIAEFE